MLHPVTDLHAFLFEEAGFLSSRKTGVDREGLPARGSRRIPISLKVEGRKRFAYKRRADGVDIAAYDDLRDQETLKLWRYSPHDVDRGNVNLAEDPPSMSGGEAVRFIRERYIGC